MPISRLTLQQQVRDELLGWIQEGKLAAGQRITEERLSNLLSVSRTPIREALRGLEREGLVCRAGRGYSVAAINEQMVREVYPMLCVLECLGLRLGMPRLAALCDRLDELNRGMEESGVAAASRYSLDSEFHQTLAGTHDNASLQQELDRLRRMVRGYDGAWERGLADVRGSCAAHAAIVTAIRAGDPVSAERTLTRHWEEGTEVVCEWLKRREGEGK